MNLFKTVKESVTVKQAAALYGLPVTSTWMTRCPFHEDHTPSMKLNDTYHYCFGCGATGDVIDFTARLFDLSSFQAARKLAQDFGLSPDKPPSVQSLCPSRPLSLSPTRQAAAYGAIWESKLWSGLRCPLLPGDKTVYGRTWPFRYVRMYEARTDASGERLQRA